MQIALKQNQNHLNFRHVKVLTFVMVCVIMITVNKTNTQGGIRMDKTLIKQSVKEMTTLIERIEKETGFTLVMDRLELKRHSKGDWKRLTPFELGTIVQAWKYNMVISKPYINPPLKRCLLSEIARGEL